jgi:predicted MPP superfamily phosphohydrolase
MTDSPNISRRRFLAGAGVLAAGAVGGDAFGFEPRWVRMSRHDVSIPDLPKGLDGIRIAQLSDLHLPANRGAAERTLALVKAERPEIVVLTGDQCETASGVADVSAFVTEARGTVATLAVLGNWDYRGSTVGEVARLGYEAAGATLLVNSHAIVRVGGTELAFVGLDDLLGGTPDVRAATAGVPDGAATILLAHEPGPTDDPLPSDVPTPMLTLSGHTHGGQIRIPGLPARTPIGSGRFLAGWYSSAWGRLYVSRGIGTADIRARLFCPPELPVFTLRRA